MAYSANRYLTRDEMEVNAHLIHTFFDGVGWTLNAIAAMLGNMESESTINPGIYENLDDTSTTNGFGLVQWTPNTKYKTWADANGFEYGAIYGQLMKIWEEQENEDQWIPTTTHPLTFTEFSKSTESPETLAQAFLYNYERPADLNQPNRSTQARWWFTLLSGGTPDNPDTPVNPDIPTPTPTKMSKLLLYFAGTRR